MMGPCSPSRHGNGPIQWRHSSLPRIFLAISPVIDSCESRTCGRCRMDVKAAAPRATPLLESSWKAAYCDGWSGSGVGRRSVLARPVAGPTRGGLAGAGGLPLWQAGRHLLGTWRELYGRGQGTGGTYWENIKCNLCSHNWQLASDANMYAWSKQALLKPVFLCNAHILEISLHMSFGRKFTLIHYLRLLLRLKFFNYFPI